MMRRRVRGLAALATVTALALMLTGCFWSGPTLHDKATGLAQTLEKGGLGVSRADVSAPSSFTGSLVVTVVLDEEVVDRGSSITAQELEKILRVVGEGATDMRVGSALLYAEDDQGSDVDMTRAADELGLSDNVSGRSLSFSGAELERLASA